MIDRETAVQIVEGQLARDYEADRAVRPDPILFAVAGVEEHELVWIVSWTSKEYLRTGNPDFRLVGNGPYLVDGLDGSLHQIGVVSAVTDGWQEDYRTRIRGQTVRTAVDDLHDEVRGVAAARGRIHAMHTLRQRLPVLSLAEVFEYVGALQAGTVPDHLVTVATKELVPSADPVLTATTIRGAVPSAG
ncbi:YrhB domain-containing protein [Streptomyces microflavus]|uniref:YrhB domain-containing protein n=1 Tax=Streptomyces microflavus TaxID=1919 RepID=UPI0033D9F98B